MTDLAAVLMAELRIDSGKVRSDVEAGVKSVDTSKAGDAAGTTFGERFKAKAIIGMTAAMDSLVKMTGNVKAVIPVGADPASANLSVDLLKKRLDELGQRVTKTKVGADDTAGQAVLASFQARLTRLNAEIAKPGISVQGQQKALADILAVSAALDKLSAKKATPNISGGGSSGGGKDGSSLLGGLAGGAGPGMTGAPGGLSSGTTTALIGGIGSALATLPALAGVVGTGIGVALIGGAVAAAVKGSPALKAQFTAIGKDAQAMLQQAAAPLLPAISKVLDQVPALLKSIQPQLASVFSAIAPQIQSIFTGLIPIINGVLGIMKAAAPAFGPVLVGLESLIASILPGIQTVITAMVPFLQQFAGILTTLGKNLGSFFAAAAPAIGASMQVLGTLLNLVGALLPAVMQIAGAFATALAPVLTQFGNAIKAMTPFLVTLGGIIAELAKAIMTTLAGALTAVAAVLTNIAPALNAFAKMLGQVFAVLQNSGVFTALANAIMSLAGPISQLINSLLQGLMPILPPLISFFGQFASLLAGIFAKAIAAILPVLTQIIRALLQFLQQVILPLLPSILKLVSTLGDMFVKALTAILPILLQFVSMLLKFYQQAVVPLLPVIIKLAETLAGAILKALMALLPALLPIIAAFLQFLQKAILPLLPVLAQFATMLINVLVKAIVPLLPQISQLIVMVINFLTKALTPILPALMQLAAALVKVLLAFLPLLGPILQITTLLLNLAIKALLPLIPVITLVVNVLTVIVNALAVVIGWIVQAIAVIVKFGTSWTNVKNTIDAAWKWIVANVLDPMKTFFTVTIPGWWDQFTGFVNTKLVQPFQNALKGAWTWVQANVLNPIKDFFLVTIPGWWDQFLGFLNTRLILPWRIAIQACWNWIVANVLNPIHDFFLVTIPSWWDSAINFLKIRFVTPFQNAIKGAWDWVVNNVFNPLKTFITVTLPGMFDTAVTAVGKAWTKIQDIVKVPVKWVLQHVIDPLFGGIDAVTFFVGLGRPLPTDLGNNMAAGGKVTGGVPGKDSVLAALTPGEVVVPEPMVTAGAVDHLRGKLPGFADGGMVSSDQVFKLAQSSGIPSLSYTSGYRPGGTNAHATGNAADIASWDSGSTDSKTPMNELYNWIYKNWHGSYEVIHWPYGGIKAGKDVGGSFWPESVWLQHKDHVHWAVDYPGYKGKAGGGPGILGQIGAFLSKTLEDVFSTLSKFGTVGIDLAKGDVGGAAKAMLAALHLPSGVGGAQGQFGKVLAALPGNLLGKAMKFLTDKVKSFADGQMAAGGVPGGNGPTSADAQAAMSYAKSRMGAFGWGGSNEWDALVTLWNGESGWDRLARNKGSGAYGIPQALPGSKMGAAANPPTSSAGAQIDWGMNYIKSTYKDPVNAITQWLARSPHWYGGGGVIPEPVTGIGHLSGDLYKFAERGPETVLPGVGGDADLAGRLDKLASLMGRLIDTTASVPAGVGRHMGGALSGVAADASFRSRYPRGGA